MAVYKVDVQVVETYHFLVDAPTAQEARQFGEIRAMGDEEPSFSEVRPAATRATYHGENWSGA